VHKKAQAPDAAKAFLAFLSSAENLPFFRQKGFD